MAALDSLTEEAVALAGAFKAGGEDLDAAVEKLAESGDRAALAQARTDLVQRIHERSDDFEATAALNLVNRALARVGWYDPYNWKLRRKP
jgi:hypothetical protein